MPEYRNPKPTVDIVLVVEPDRSGDSQYDFIVLIKRKNPPHGWALPGGFVNEGESFEAAAVREAKEEIGANIELFVQFYTYSDPKRDPRQHNSSTVYIARLADSREHLAAADDAADIKVVMIKDALEMDLAFDHKRIIKDVLAFLNDGVRPPPVP